MKFHLYLLLSAALFSVFACKSRPGPSSSNNTFDPDTMEKMWKKVDSLESKGLYTSALEEILQIKKVALAGQESGHLVKAIMYENRYLLQLEEDSALKALQRAEAEVNTYPEPAKSVMHAMIADWYATYLRGHLWELKNRTEFEGPAGPDIRNWGVRHFVDTIQSHYYQSVQWEGLQTADVSLHTLLLTEDQKTDNLRPTLYDILMHKALDYYMGAESFLTQPQYAFVLNDPKALSPAVEFVQHTFTSKDTLSQVWISLQWFQQLLKFRLTQSEQQSALLDAELKRLLYAFSQLQHDEKDSLYLSAIRDLREKYIGNPEVTLVDYHLAEWYIGKGDQWNRKPDDSDRFAYKKALEICQEAIKNFPEAYGAQLCLGLIDRIKQVSLSANMESINLPGEELLAKVDYKNLSQLYFTVVQLPEAPKRWTKGNWDGEEILRRLQQLPQIKTWVQPIDNGQDYQQHATEIALPALPAGHYALMVSEAEKPQQNKSTAGSIMFTVSSLAYWYLDDKEQTEAAAILNRATGKPEEGVKVEFYTSQYNPALRQHEEVKLGEAISNADGWVNIPAHENKSISLKLTKGKDELYMDESYYSYRPGRTAGTQPTTLFFTDRSIYRPGQKLFFKGFALEFDQQRIPSTATKKDVTVTLFDANNKEVTKQVLRTNDYGTFSGYFDLPSGGLTGKMSIASSHGSNRYYFSVEEYKRPKFEVTFDTIRQSYRLGQEVVLQGKALDFAGSPVSGAVATYRVERVAYQPWWWGYRMYFPRQNDRQVLTTGTDITDLNGKVNIPFQASGKSGDEPGMMYRFEVTLAVTDVTGETHESVKTIVLNEQGYVVNIQIPESITLDALDSIEVVTSNSDGIPIKVNGELQISQLTQPSHHHRDRLWPSPDVMTLTPEDYASRFINYTYPGQEHISTWPAKATGLKESFSVDGRAKVNLTSVLKSSGYYKLSWKWMNENGKELVMDQYTMVYTMDQKLPGAEVLRVHTDDRAYHPGDKVSFDLLTGLPDAPHVIQLVEHRTGASQRQWLNGLKDPQTTLTLLENDRGGVLTYHLSAYNNRFYRNQQRINVPWTNKMLDVALKTWRDKLEPGDQETWTLTVTGKDREKLTSEVLLSMYDASLDAFLPHQWQMSLFPSITGRTSIQSTSAVAASLWGLTYNATTEYRDVPVRQYRYINSYGYYPDGYYYGGGRPRGGKRYKGDDGVLMMQAHDGAPIMQANEEIPAPSAMPEADAAAKGDLSAREPSAPAKADTPPGQSPPLRTALDETVFFYPQLLTDENGNLTFNFKMKEGLTRWKFQALGHTRDLAFGLTQEEIVTRKNLMVFPNPPRFFRTSDTIAFQAKVTNLTDKVLDGNATLKILDAYTREDVSGTWGLSSDIQTIQVPANGSKGVSWMLRVPADWYKPVVYQVFAQTGTYTDGEEALLPVVTNRVLITESLPLPVKANETRTFIFKSMLDRSSATLEDHRYTVEMTTSPAWYAVQALPYLMEYPHQCAEQVFSRLYANSLAAHIANKYPSIRNTYDTWRLTQSDALLSNLEKNTELKNVMLEETPWVRDAMGETSQKKSIALLFEQNRMDQEARQALQQLQQVQLSNGGFPWFPGGRDNWYITQYIVEGLGHLRKMGVNLPDQGGTELVAKAIPYLDARMIEWYDELKALAAKGKIKMEDHHISAMQLHYLYARSFFPEIEHVAKMDDVNTYVLQQMRQYWMSHSVYEQGLMASGLHRRLPNDPLPVTILASLRERTIYHEELGRYWKINPGYHWNEAAVELQALMVELFQDMSVPQAEVDELRVWLLKQKQTTQWKSTKATASAIYALLIHPDAWLSSSGIVEVSLGQKEIIGQSSTAEAGTGYVKKSWEGDEIRQDWSSIKVVNPNNHIAWGSAYWQYWEDLDKIKSNVTDNPLKITRSLLMVQQSDRGEVSVPADANALKVGDQLIVRLEIESDRVMEFVHLKDMRAAGFEPVDVLSGYTWQGNLGYYMSTKDLATHFFIDHLPRGKFVIEYKVNVAQSGQYSEGLAQLQCMYAPEFGAHSTGKRVKVISQR